ncbi:hypothetical protein HPB52_003506 [Rhipicephalus sanguineus]|uniref:Uncharacterized protein n=1 Tax=Rhipicephalus sanguineus TaxID=34632 RepID=A0A9D4QGT0_RHISA|nr:hypothetical protein HPB52_003506 [Rhipicephalus sanguineus]
MPVVAYAGVVTFERAHSVVTKGDITHLSSLQRIGGHESDEGSRRYGVGSGASSRRGRSTLKKRIIASSRMPDLPEDHRRIVIRPRDGLDLRKAGHCKVAEAIMAAAKITYDAAGEDVVCPNVTQNIVVVSTPLEEHAKNYVRIKQIKVGEKVYNVNAYYSADSDEENGLKSQDGNDSFPEDLKIFFASKSGATNGGAMALPIAQSPLALGHNPAQGLVISRRKQHGRRRLVV